MQGRSQQLLGHPRGPGLVAIPQYRQAECLRWRCLAEEVSGQLNPPIEEQPQPRTQISGPAPGVFVSGVPEDGSPPVGVRVDKPNPTSSNIRDGKVEA